MSLCDASLTVNGPRFVLRLTLLPILITVAVGTAVPAQARQQSNTRVSNVLRLFDIDGLNGPDLSADGDGDGLPDTWEVGGTDKQNSDVPFPAPSAIVPGSPPTSIFARRAVRTSATAREARRPQPAKSARVISLRCAR
ncbi:MAG: hypothetical protein IID33_09835 [Planctomycetes bacterium]|nr:hypothetical protein [Planctomycetota bacterium]